MFRPGQCPYEVENPEEGGYIGAIELPHKGMVFAYRLARDSSSAEKHAYLAVIKFWHESGILNDHLKLAYQTLDMKAISDSLDPEDSKSIRVTKDSLIFTYKLHNSMLNEVAKRPG
jgi:hypothetical protein